jgi:hypothetical protein
MDSGSAIPSTSREDFHNLPVVAPPVIIQRKFTQLIAPIWQRQEQNLQSCLVLANIRDTLLPTPYFREAPGKRLFSSEGTLMSDQKQRYQLPKRIDHYLATLAKLYAQEGQREKEEIVVNAQVRVQEEWSYDNWNGGTAGHALILTLPEFLYLGLVRKREDLQSEIRKDLNKVHNCQSEFIEEIFIEMEEVEDQDWRRRSGLLQSGTRVILPDAAARVWGDSGYRVFLSHKAEVKKKTAELKDSLAVFGVSCFVAHEDIHPTKEWQEEIDNALASMDAFVALMTNDFHDSDWTTKKSVMRLGVEYHSLR